MLAKAIEKNNMEAANLIVKAMEIENTTKAREHELEAAKRAREHELEVAKRSREHELETEKRKHEYKMIEFKNKTAVGMNISKIEHNLISLHFESHFVTPF